MNELMRQQSEDFLRFCGVCLRYLCAMIFYLAMGWLTIHAVTGDAAAWAVVAVNWIFVIFYGALQLVFLAHIAIFIFWRKQ